MELEHRFAVQAPPDETFELLLDLRRIAPCLPGAEITERLGDGRYAADMSVRIGPIRMTYRGEIAITEVDRVSRRSTMHAEARDIRGRGSVKADITMRLAGSESAAHVDVTTALTLTGRVAQMGRSVVQDAANELLDRFVENIAALAGEMQADASDCPPGPAARSGRGNAPVPSALGMLVRIVRLRLRQGLARLASAVRPTRPPA